MFCFVDTNTDYATEGGTSDWQVVNSYDYANRWVRRQYDSDGASGSTPGH